MTGTKKNLLLYDLGPESAALVNIEDFVKKHNITAIYPFRPLPVMPPGLLSAEHAIDAKQLAAMKKELMDAIIDLGDDKVEGRSVRDWLGNEPNSPNLLLYQRFRVFFNLVAYYQVRYCIEQLKKEWKVIVLSHNNRLKSDQQDNEDIEINIIPIQPVKTDYLSVIYYLVFFILRVIIGSVRSLNTRNYQYLMLEDSSLYARMFDPKEKRYVYKNIYLKSLKNKFGKKLLILDKLPFKKLRNISHFRIKKFLFHTGNGQKTLYNEYILVSGLFNRKVRKQAAGVNDELHNNLEHIRKEFTGLKRLILDELASLRSVSKFYIYQELLYHVFFRKRNIRKMIAIDENSISSRGIFNAAKKQGVDTYGVQHGIITELSPLYRYSRGDMKLDPVPDRTLIWGDKWKALLIDKGHYPENRLEVVGQLRTDIINGLLSNKSMLAGLTHLPTDKPVVVYASQPLPDERLRERMFRDVISAARACPEIHFVVKLHPAEEVRWFGKRMDGASLPNVEIVKKMDLYVLLLFTGIVITGYSTVGLEGLYFGNELIVLDYHQEDMMSYHKDGVGYLATSAEELITVVRRICEGTDTKQEHIQKYLERMTYKIDGRVADRCVNIIGQDKNEKLSE